MPFVPPSSLAPSSVTILGTVTVAQPVAVTVDSLPLPSGAATEATLASAKASLDDIGLTAILQRERMETE